MNYQALIDALRWSLDHADWNSWAREFIENIKDRDWHDLSDKQKIKVVELTEELEQIHFPMMGPEVEKFL